jgi:hypothetical protein
MELSMYAGYVNGLYLMLVTVNNPMISRPIVREYIGWIGLSPPANYLLAFLSTSTKYGV